jgi:tetratricopeptide (TPR) repeat protein
VRNAVRIAGGLLAGCGSAVTLLAAAPDALARLDQAMAAAEAGLRAGDAAAAETEYRVALAEGHRLMALPPAERGVIEGRVEAAIAHAWFNLGVLHAQARRFADAAAMFAETARMQPEFPQVQYSLGVSYFNAGAFEKAAEPLARALAITPGDGDLRRMLALAFFQTEAYDKAADLLAADLARSSDPALQHGCWPSTARSPR